MTLMTQDTSQTMATIIMLSFTFIFGGIGNALVIVVYTRKHDHLTTTLFINILAIVDCFTCVVIIPMTIYVEYWEWGFSNVFLCKIYYFFNNCTIPFSALLISLIAIDRYMCICHPFNKFFTLSRSKISITLALILSLLIGAASVFQMKIISSGKMVNSSNPLYSKNDKHECAEVSKINNSTISDKIFFNIVQKSQLIIYTLCIVIVILLYIAIYYTVLKSRSKKKKLKGSNITNKPTYLWNNSKTNSNNQNQSEFSIKLPECDLLSSSKSTPCSKTFLTVPKPEARRVSLKSICDTQIFQNFRTAAMLFVVAIMYIISFLPAFLMIIKVVQLYLPIFYMYYLNNAVNPIIYCFMNARFREDIRVLWASFHN